MGLGKFRQKCVPSYTFFRCGDYLEFWIGLRKLSTKRCGQWHLFGSADYLKFLRGLGKFRQKGVTSYTFFSQCRLTWVFDGTCKKKFTKKCAQSFVFSLWRLTLVFDGTWKNFHKKVCPVKRFFAVETILSFWMGLRKVSTKMCAQLHVFSLWRLTWVFDGTWKNFHKKVCPVICFFAVETNFSFWWDLEKFSQKSVPSHTFLLCGDYLKFLRGLGKFRQKGVTSYTFFSQCRLS